jgi:hypothetical protein
MRARLIAIITVIVLLLIVFAACHKRPTPKPIAEALPPIGKTCTVQLRRDAMGAAAPVPIPPLSANHNGVDTCVTGKLKMINADWVVIDRNGADLWVPKSSVLLVQF